MTPEKILEIAAENESHLYSERVWAFDEEALIAFAQSVIEAEREAQKLTDKDIDDVIQSQCWAYGFDANAYPFARAIERRINGEEE